MENVQLNEYETAPYNIFELNQNLTCDCLLISVFCPKFTLAQPEICFEHQNRTILDSAQVNLGKKTEINKQSHVKFWLS